MGIFSFLKRKKVVTDEERREWLLTTGRITDGVIVETEVNEEGECIAHYSYFVHGVEFQSSDRLTKEQEKEQLKYAEGASVAVRFDPRHHGNAILV